MVWLFWALAAAASVQLAPNPLYVTLVIATAALVVEGHATDGPLAGAFRVLLVAGLVFGGLRLVLTVVTTHGSGAALFRLPEATLPALLGGFTVGGTVEGPVLARAAAEGWALVGVMAAFGAFNAVVSHDELVRSAPRAFYEVGLAITVALAFVPSLFSAARAVRESDRARTGCRTVARGRLFRQLVPILEIGMERAVALSESMDSRGFGHGDASRQEARAGWLSLGGLLCLGGCAIALVAGSSRVAAVLAVTAAGAVVVATVGASRAGGRARYRPRRVHGREWALAGVAWLSPVGLAVLSWGGDRSLVWPADRLALPGLSLLAVGALALLAVPALRPARRSGAGG